MPVRQQKESLSSVKVRFLDAPKIIEELKAISREIVEKDRNIIGIYLFGSLVKNNYSLGSDADILVLLEKDSRRFIDRIPHYAKLFLDISIPVEVFPYTEEEIKKMLCEENHFIKNIWKEKIILSERKDTSTPP